MHKTDTVTPSSSARMRDSFDFKNASRFIFLFEIRFGIPLILARTIGQDKVFPELGRLLPVL